MDVVATGQGVHGLALAPPDKSRVAHSGLDIRRVLTLCRTVGRRFPRLVSIPPSLCFFAVQRSA